ncbi:hypothetical protein J3458_005670 [Metarhizium acridum]|uniref:uncharacterized protein n=1 Tax=Metarhizium acridum TaxID=92637 RepID=UPI001C6CFAEC|nr:hypothetical protein J3458_005670 [Metarhizium acridum]
MPTETRCRQVANAFSTAVKPGWRQALFGIINGNMKNLNNYSVLTSDGQSRVGGNFTRVIANPASHGQDAAQLHVFPARLYMKARLSTADTNSTHLVRDENITLSVRFRVFDSQFISSCSCPMLTNVYIVTRATGHVFREWNLGLGAFSCSKTSANSQKSRNERSINGFPIPGPSTSRRAAPPLQRWLHSAG